MPTTQQQPKKCAHKIDLHKTCVYLSKFDGDGKKRGKTEHRSHVNKQPHPSKIIRVRMVFFFVLV